MSMMADAPLNIERLAKVERDFGWVKLIGSGMAVAIGAVFWQLYTLNAHVATLDAHVAALGATVTAMDAKLDAMAATLAVIADN